MTEDEEKKVVVTEGGPMTDEKLKFNDEAGTVTEISKAKKPSGIELKRARQYAERRLRLINRGVDPAKVDAVIRQEDYDAMPIEEKFKRFSQAMNQAIGGLARDIMGLRHNDGIISDSIDLNNRAMARCLEKAGIDLLMQHEIVTAVTKEMEEERQKEMEAEQKKAQAQPAVKEAQAVQGLKESEAKQVLTESEGREELPPPDGATIFGGP